VEGATGTYRRAADPDTAYGYATARGVTATMSDVDEAKPGEDDLGSGPRSRCRYQPRSTCVQ
jgi:hypothetical protein